MTRVSFVLAAFVCAAGCGGDKPPAVGDPTKKISWADFQKMPPEEHGDPYVLNNLDDDAKKKLAEKLKKGK